MSDSEEEIKVKRRIVDDEDEAPVSPSPVEEAQELQEELDDLFGDDDDEEQPAMEEDEEDEEAMYNKRFLGDDVAEEDEEPRQIKEADIQLARHQLTTKLDNPTFYARLPQYLTLEPYPFDAETFKEDLESKRHAETEEKLDNKLINENTLRWRYSRDSSNKVVKQSNTQIVQWSDGTYSLKVGSEYMDIAINSIDNVFLAVSHDQHAILQNVEELQKNMLFIPASTRSKLHQRLKDAVVRKRDKEETGFGVNTVYVNNAPELEVKKMEREHEAVLRERRKQREREEAVRNGDIEEDELGTGYKPSGRHHVDEYEDDGFMVDDEEEEEEEEEEEDEEDSEDDLGAERLKQVKKSGADEYKRNRDDDSEEEEVSRRKRPAIIDDEEDE